MLLLLLHFGSEKRGLSARERRKEGLCWRGRAWGRASPQAEGQAGRGTPQNKLSLQATSELGKESKVVWESDLTTDDYRLPFRVS